MKTACAFAPATIANLNVGFDILGMALSKVGDKVEVTINGTSENRITEIVDGPGLPDSVKKNCCSVVIRKMQDKLQSFEGVDIRIKKGFASGSGLGSSSASSAAAAFAYNELIGKPFSLEELVQFAGEGERVASGSAHLDNVAPAILGGLVLIQKGKLVPLPIPENLHVVSFFPQVEVKTSQSRNALSNSVDLSLVSDQIANMAAVVSSLYENDLHRFASSMNDVIIEPQRKSLIPKFDEMKSSAIYNGALAFGISGSGPSVFAFCENPQIGIKVEDALTQLFSESSTTTQSFVESVSGNSGCVLTSFN